MTRSRYLAGFMAVGLFALALGIALGSGPLQGDVGQALSSSDTADDADRDAADAARERTQRYDNEFATALRSELLVDTLTDRGVLLLALPGADEDATEAVADDVEAAGGSVTTTLQVDEELIDPGARVLVDTLAKRLAKEDASDVDIDADAPVYERVGVVLSRALLTGQDGGTALDDSARSIFNSFTTADLLAGKEPETRASLAIVVAGAGGATSESTSAQGAIVNALLTQMDGASDGVVLAGPPSAAESGGSLAALRSDDETAQTVSSVDTVDQRSGQIVTVLAAAEQARGETGQYGVARAADAPMPAGSSSSR